MAPMKKFVSVGITSDLVCPWCYIGLRKLQEAAKIANVETKISWKPFMLRPNTPEDGMPKGGTPASRVGQRLKMAGEASGIDFTGLTDRTPNTALFHSVMHHLNGNEKQTAFHEAVFDAYFTKGIYPNRQALINCAEQAGVGDQVKALFNDEEKVQELRELVHKEAQDASHGGIHGVPFFEFNNEPAFSGAQDISTFVQYLNRHAQQVTL